MEQFSIGTAFIGGLLSFLSPCILPLVPAYLSFISGVSVEELQADVEAGKYKVKVMLASFGFIAGFSFVFVILGASATFIGQYFLDRLPVLSKIAGIIVIILGIHMAGFFKIRTLYRDVRFNFAAKPVGFFGAFFMGIAFSVGWTPCVGPILAGILSLAGAQDTAYEGIYMLASYALGIGVPFLLAGFGIEYFFLFFTKIKKYFKVVEIISGSLLIAIGLLIVTGYYNKITSFLTIW